MKKIIFIIVSTLALVLFASCDRNKDYVRKSYVTFNAVKYTVSEDVGTLTIPVSLHNCCDAVNATIKCVDGTGVSGTNYELVTPNSGVLAFSNTDTTKDVVVNIKNLKGQFTGDRVFTVQLASSTEGVESGVSNVATVTIKDLDHPLANILGKYKVTCYGVKYGNSEYELTLTPDADDVTMVWCDYIVPMLSDLASYGNGATYGMVNEAKNVISFPIGQNVGTGEDKTKWFQVGYGTFNLYGCQYPGGYNLTQEGTIDMTLQAGSGVVWKSNDGIAIADKYVWPSYGGFILGPADSHEIVWTKE